MLTVDDYGPADFNSIQKAINNASSGDTVFVYSGTYFEHVVINKSIALVGEDRDFTIIDGNRTGNVISITVNNVSVEGFTIKRSGMYPGSGVFVGASRENTISNNKILWNYEGISLYYSSNNVISDNIASNNSEGIYLYSSSDNMLSDNVISHNEYEGFSLYSSSGNVISENTILNNSLRGISFYYSSSTVVCCNIISRNNYGIDLGILSNDNTIYHNNFRDNFKSVSVSSDLTNNWTYDNEGNYWSDYIGQDLNEDGIGDNPYVIDKNNQDSRPLMGMFNIFDVTLGRKIYQVTVISNSTISGFQFEVGKETGNKIINFNVVDKNGSVGFCRVTIPTELMRYPFIVLTDDVEVTPTLLNVSDITKSCLYFIYFDKNIFVSIIYSETLHLYYELLAEHSKLQGDLYSLNQTYYGLLYNYFIIQEYLQSLNESYYGLEDKYNVLLENYQALLGNYNTLQESVDDINASYYQHLSDYSGQNQNMRSLMYMFAATVAVLIIITIYFSWHTHASLATRTKPIENEE